MALAKKNCRVCSKPYEACRSTKKGSGVFHWQEVACSPVCGAAYLQGINESRGLVQKSKQRGKYAQSTAAEQVTEVSSENIVGEEVLDRPAEAAEAE